MGQVGGEPVTFGLAPLWQTDSRPSGSGWSHLVWRPKNPASVGTQNRHFRSRLPSGRDPSSCGRLTLMQIGVAYPQNELRGDPTAVGRFGRAVEDRALTTSSRTTTCSGPFTPIERLH